jgi:misacylated tRNA(Ala) deacylase
MTEALFRENSYLQSCRAKVVAVGENGIELDRTVFFATGGGQPGDTGVLRTVGGEEIRISDTVKGDAPAMILHVPEAGAALPAPGEEIEAVIDWERRWKLMQMHTALHLFCVLVKGEITGAQVGAEKSRIDFNLPDQPLDKAALQAGLDRLIAENHPVTARWIDDAEFDERPDLVRSLSVRPPRGMGRVRLVQIGDIDLQACGGTHVAATGEIAPLAIGKIENKGRQNRRINVRFADA